MRGVDILTSVIIHAGTSSSQSGGGSSPSVGISVATTSSGSFDNAVKIGIFNSSNGTFNLSNGIKDGSNSLFANGTNPTRTLQLVTIPASDYLAGYNASGTGQGHIMIGGYIRQSGFTSPFTIWSVTSNTILSQSFATVTAIALETNDSRRLTQDNTNLNTGFGIYSSLNSATGTGYYRIILQHGGGRGSSTLPQAGDSITFRLSADSQTQAGAQYAAIHDVTINFT